MAKNKNEFDFKFGVPVYWLNPVNNPFNSDFGKALRKGLPIEQELYISHKEIEGDEVVKVLDNKGEITHWLVKNEILSGINKKGNRCGVRTTPIKKVEIEKEHPDKKGYVIIKSNYNKL